MIRARKPVWRSPEELVEIAFQRASVVMMNEAHDGWKRCIRTRQIGQRILPVAHQAGVRHIAMEALYPAFVEQCHSTRVVPAQAEAYLAQPEMKSLVQTALDLGWTLIPYEADPFKWITAKHGVEFSDSVDSIERQRQYQEFQADFPTLEYTNWREEQQARNLIDALQSLPAGVPMLVWCGNSHLSKRPAQGWLPMGYQFNRLSRIDSFAIDQTRTVKFNNDKYRLRLIRKFEKELGTWGGTAGFLREQAPFSLGGDKSVDAKLLSTDNELE